MPWLLTAFLAVLFASAPVSGDQAGSRKQASALSDFREQHRPQFHFSPPSMWMNDPNGLVYFDGEYHLFYQHYPHDVVWGPMHWGHAVSTDLVHWEFLPIALRPDELGYIFSGSAVVDRNDTTGFGTGGKPPLVAVFTYHNPELAEAGGRDHEYQGIAYSNDRGRTWTKYENNPVLPNTQKLQDFRDPKVFWHEASGKWVMALSATDHVQFWGSGDLKSWEKLSEFGRNQGAHGGVWECPDLVELPVEGSSGKRWVLILNLNPGGPQGGSGTQYFVGDFDGTTFSLDAAFERLLREQGPAWLDSGKDNYAGVTWANVPEEDGRTLFIGWMGNWDYAQQVPTWPWRSAMTLPRVLSLRAAGGTYRLVSRPVEELTRLRGRSLSLGAETIRAGEALPLPSPFPLSLSEIILEFERPEEGDFSFTLELSNAVGERYRMGYESGSDSFFSDRSEAGDHSFSNRFTRVHRSPRLSDEDRVRLHLFLDVASAELFADHGLNVMTELFFPGEPFTRAAIRVTGQDVQLAGATLYELNRIWSTAGLHAERGRAGPSRQALLRPLPQQAHPVNAAGDRVLGRNEADRVTTVFGGQQHRVR